jgi:hypothetical protein
MNWRLCDWQYDDIEERKGEGTKSQQHILQYGGRLKSLRSTPSMPFLSGDGAIEFISAS